MKLNKNDEKWPRKASESIFSAIYKAENLISGTDGSREESVIAEQRNFYFTSSKSAHSTDHGGQVALHVAHEEVQSRQRPSPAVLEVAKAPVAGYRLVTANNPKFEIPTQIYRRSREASRRSRKTSWPPATLGRTSAPGPTSAAK